MPIDPVCGMEVGEDTSFKVEYRGGRMYYFCSPGVRLSSRRTLRSTSGTWRTLPHHGHSHRRMQRMGGCHH
ncbi:YHS domain-containing protein [Thermococcus peptonophilus]|uniref:YHS domain-containing protein n=1 Tax=Thermococcus peptonophilus TaxID=53952 RepID=UPI000A5F2AF3